MPGMTKTTDLQKAAVGRHSQKHNSEQSQH